MTTRTEAFRADLFYRLSVFPVSSPPLREHPDDMPALAEFFLKRSAEKFRVRPAPRLTKGQARELSAYPCPGNVRELENTIERALILAAAREGKLEFGLPQFVAQSNPPAVGSVHPAQSLAGGDGAKLDQLIARLCDRHQGVGADGVMLVETLQTVQAQWRMRYYNADGGEAELCGNGARCFARFATRLETAVGDDSRSQGSVTFQTQAGLIHARLESPSVSRVTRWQPLSRAMSIAARSSADPLPLPRWDG